MAKKKKDTSSKQVVRILQSAGLTTIWTYDPSISMLNPASVEIIYDDEEKKVGKKKKKSC